MGLLVKLQRVTRPAASHSQTPGGFGLFALFSKPQVQMIHCKNTLERKTFLPNKQCFGLIFMLDDGWIAQGSRKLFSRGVLVSTWEMGTM